MKHKRQPATIITETMATWKFIFIFLVLCGVEIWFNRTDLVPQEWQYDKTMLVLNTFLSLLAAIQGSIIMIDQRMADRKRDQMLQQILKIERKRDKYAGQNE